MVRAGFGDLLKGGVDRKFLVEAVIEIACYDHVVKHARKVDSEIGRLVIEVQSLHHLARLLVAFGQLALAVSTRIAGEVAAANSEGSI